MARIALTKTEALSDSANYPTGLYCLFIDGHDQIAFSQSYLSGRTILFNRHDLDRPFIDQIVETHQATTKRTFSANDPQITASHPAMGEQL